MIYFEKTLARLQVLVLCDIQFCTFRCQLRQACFYHSIFFRHESRWHIWFSLLLSRPWAKELVCCTSPTCPWPRTDMQTRHMESIKSLCILSCSPKRPLNFPSNSSLWNTSTGGIWELLISVGQLIFFGNGTNCKMCHNFCSLEPEFFSSVFMEVGWVQRCILRIEEIIFTRLWFTQLLEIIR